MEFNEILKIVGAALLGAFIRHLSSGSEKQHDHEVRISLLAQEVKLGAESRVNTERDIKALWREQDKLKARLKGDRGKGDDDGDLGS